MVNRETQLMRKYIQEQIVAVTNLDVTAEFEGRKKTGFNAQKKISHKEGYLEALKNVLIVLSKIEGSK